MTILHTYAEAFALPLVLRGRPVVQGFVPEALPLPVLLFDVEHGGRGRVSGTVKVKGTPDYAVRRRVRLIRDRDGKLIREMWSDATTGAYQFDYVDERERYTVLAYDYTQAFRAVVADNLTPEIIP